MLPKYDRRIGFSEDFSAVWTSDTVDKFQYFEGTINVCKCISNSFSRLLMFSTRSFLVKVMQP